MTNVATSSGNSGAAYGDLDLTSRHAVFLRGHQLFAVGVDLLREVLPGQPLTRVARSRPQVLGVLNLRGEILPVVVIDGWLGLPPTADDTTLPILVLRRGELLVGVRVDAIMSVMNVPMREVQSHPATSGETLLSGIWQPEGSRPITIIAGPVLLDTLCRETSSNL